MNTNQLIELAERKVKSLTLAISQSAFTNIRQELEGELALAKFALSALQEHCKAAEPIYEYYPDDGWVECSKELYDEMVRLGYDARIVYSAPPVPVVLEIDRKAIAEKVYGKCCRIPGATFYNAAEFAIDEMEACHAAMLQTGDFRENKDSSTGYFRENKETSTKSESTQWPHRTVRLTFSHETVGDQLFYPMMLAAHQELVNAMSKRGDPEEFTASNCVSIKCENLTRYDSEL
ncbi:hypothetical protein BKM35_22240 [Salmonella enterica]|nr:hypothetical protein [Salmonella enterica]